MEIVPVETVVGAVAVILVAEFTVKLDAGALLNLTALAAVKAVPVIVTFVPIVPLAGENELTCGAVACATSSKNRVPAIATASHAKNRQARFVVTTVSLVQAAAPWSRAKRPLGSVRYSIIIP
jgi:hypothetical protein